MSTYFSIRQTKQVSAVPPQEQPATTEQTSQLNIPRLHQLIDGKKGKAVALAIFCAAKLGLITQTDYNAVSEEFGDIGERSNYNKYLANPQRFSPIDIESTTNFLTQTP